jgi:hypothetical protein
MPSHPDLGKKAATNVKTGEYGKEEK